MSNSHLHRTTGPARHGMRTFHTPLPNGSFMVPMNDPVDALHSEQQPEPAVDRHREMVILDRIFWTSIGLLMVTGVALKIWILL